MHKKLVNRTKDINEGKCDEFPALNRKIEDGESAGLMKTFWVQRSCIIDDYLGSSIILLPNMEVAIHQVGDNWIREPNTGYLQPSNACILTVEGTKHIVYESQWKQVEDKYLVLGFGRCS